LRIFGPARGFSTHLPGSLILQALRCQPLCHRGGHDAAIAGVCRRRCRVRGSTCSLDIVALPRPAAFLGAALGRGPDFCGSYVSHACWRSRFPQGWIPRLRWRLRIRASRSCTCIGTDGDTSPCDPCSIFLERCATAVRSSTLARLVRGDCAVTVCERSLGCTATPLTCAAGYALLAARAIQLWFVHGCTAMRLSAYSRWACSLGFSPPVLRLVCRSLMRILCVGYCVAEVVLSVPVLLGQCAPAFTAGLRRCRRGCGHVLLPIIEL
jgi:hypothetical protein